MSNKSQKDVPSWFINLSIIIIILTLFIAFFFILMYLDKDNIYIADSAEKNSNISNTTQSINQNVISESNANNNVTYKTINNSKIPIPDGFYYVGGEENTGVVISDNKKDLNVGLNGSLVGNQFVWIPCTEKQFVRKNWGSKNSESQFSEIYDEKNTRLIQSIKKYNGFYIARYEASCKIADGSVENPMLPNSYITLELEVQSKPSIYTSTRTPNFNQGYNVDNYQTGALWDCIEYGDAVYYSNKMYENSNSVCSHLPYGVEWDRILQWLIDSGNKTESQIKSNSNSWGTYNKRNLEYESGNYTSNPYNTGSNKKAVSNNIYDIAGNLSEWTQEITTNGRISRGGCYMSDGAVAPACYRSYNNVTPTGKSDRVGSVGFRVALYIK